MKETNTNPVVAHYKGQDIRIGDRVNVIRSRDGRTKIGFVLRDDLPPDPDYPEGRFGCEPVVTYFYRPSKGKRGYLVDEVIPPMWYDEDMRMRETPQEAVDFMAEHLQLICEDFLAANPHLRDNRKAG
jgi:hypothetical protein